MTATLWDPADKSAAITLSAGNRTASSVSGGNNGVRATPQSHTVGKWYLEYTNILTPGGSGQYGFATLADTLGGSGQCGVGAGGAVNMTGGGAIALGSAPDGKTVCLAIDLDNKRLWARYDAGNWNANVLNDPTTNVGGLDISLVVAAIVPYSWMQNNPGHVDINAGDIAFVQSVPSLFTAWASTPPFRQSQGVIVG